MNDRTKLPKWAQREFETLEGNLKYAERKLRDMMGESNQPTEVYIWEGIEMIPLPARTQIRFQVEGGNDRRHFDVSIRDGKLRIYGSTWYAIHPQASNSIDIEIEDRS